MERKNRIDELKAQSERLKAEEEMLNAKVAQLEKELLEAEKLRMKEETERVEKELMEKEIAELKKQLEVLEEKDVVESQPSKMEAAEPVASKESQTAAPEGLDTNVPTVDDAAGIQENISSVIMQALFNILFCLYLVFGAVCLVLFFIFDIDLIGYFAITTGILSIYAIILRNNRKKRIDAIATRLENKNVEIGVETTVTEPQNAEEALQERKIAEPEKQAELLEDKVVEPFKVETVMEPQPSKLEAAEPVATEEPQTVEAEPVMKEVSGDETDKEEGTPLQTDAVPEKSEKKNGKKKLWLILLLAFILTAAACCVVFLKLFAADDKAGNEVSVEVSVEEPVEVRVEEPVYDEAALDSLTIVGIMEEVNHLNNDHRYPYELPLSSEYSQLLTRANDITDSITRTTGAEWDDEWYDLAIPWMEPWADPDTVEYKILEYVSLGYGDDRRVEVTAEYNDPQYRGYLSTVTAVFVSEAGNWVIDNVGSHKEILADFIDRNNRAQTQVCEYVDLGLPSGVLWATCNVGASNPEEFGGYYAWGETEAKHSYGWDNYKWCRGTSETLTKYCTSISLGTVDNADELDSSDDVATVLWGSDWRMPTEEERDELIDMCVWEWTTLNRVAGFRATSKTNGNSIFFPAAGYRMHVSTENVGAACYYWTKSLYSNECYFSSYIYKYSNETDWMSIPRQAGMPVRPVWKYKKITDVITIVEEPDEAPIPVLDENGFISDSDEELVAVEEHDDKYIHDVVEEQPEFPGGMNALMRYFSENIQYPRVSRDNNSQGKTFVKFTVNSDGSIQDAEVIKSSGDVYLDKEALRVIEAMPKWKPGRQLGKAVRVKFVLPVSFRLQ